MIRFDQKTWQRFVLVLKPIFVSEMKWKVIGLLVLLCLFSISMTAVGAGLSFVGRDFITSLTVKDKEDFFHQLYRYMGVFVLATPFAVMYRYTEERLGLLWRGWLSRRLIDLYFSKRAYYRLMNDERIDNPDQRITEDVRSFTSQSLSFFLILFNSAMNVLTFGWVLYTISVNLVAAVVLCALVGSLITYFVGRPLIPLNFAQLKKEADYRYKLINVRDNAESIAFYRGERKESNRVRERLTSALDNLKLIINWNRNLSFFTNWYNYVVPIVPTVLVAPLYLEGKIEFGSVVQAGVVFMSVLNALSIIVLNFGGLSSFAAVITRLGSFWEVVIEPEHIDEKLSVVAIEERDAIGFNHVTLYTPKRDRAVVEDLSLMLGSHESLLITGTSGSGKSSLLRLFGGLWSAGSGTVIRPTLRETIFLPQRPYMVLGSFRSQLVYSIRDRSITDDELAEVLNKVGLHNTLARVGGFDKQLDWTNMLSTGEQQLVAFARLLLSGARFAFLDEATTALSAQGELNMYKLLKESVTAFVSVGHRESLEQFHDGILDLTGNGEWQFDRR